MSVHGEGSLRSLLLPTPVHNSGDTFTTLSASLAGRPYRIPASWVEPGIAILFSVTPARTQAGLRRETAL